MAKRTKRLIENSQADDTVRINKYLSDAGVCSRREADRFITSGEVTVDGVTATIGTKVSKGQKVVFQGKPVNKDEQLVLIAFNKPRGIVCTTDRSEKDNIIDYINYGKRIYPVGRLDKDSEGLILLTNDGNIVNKILRAGNNHEKEYIVTLNKQITSEFLKGMAAGVPILDTVTRPCVIKALDKFTFQIILTQGLNRQIRRMCEHFDYKVLSLQRIRIMNINLGHMQVGGYRNVTEKEIEGLKELMSTSVNTPYLADDEDGEVYDRMPQEAKYDTAPAPQRKEAFVSNRIKGNRTSNSSYKGRQAGKDNADRKLNKPVGSDNDKNFGKKKSTSDRSYDKYKKSVSKTSSDSNTYKTEKNSSKLEKTAFKSEKNAYRSDQSSKKSITYGKSDRYKSQKDDNFGKDKTGAGTRPKTNESLKPKTGTGKSTQYNSAKKFETGSDMRPKSGNDMRPKTSNVMRTRSRTAYKSNRGK